MTKVLFFLGWWICFFFGGLIHPPWATKLGARYGLYGDNVFWAWLWSIVGFALIFFITVGIVDASGGWDFYSHGTNKG